LQYSRDRAIDEDIIFCKPATIRGRAKELIKTFEAMKGSYYLVSELQPA
jgi:hypothetical protein